MELAATLIDSDEGSITGFLNTLIFLRFVAKSRLGFVSANSMFLWDYLGIATVDPEKRGCYFPGEANLTIFKVKFIVSQKWLE